MLEITIAKAREEVVDFEDLEDGEVFREEGESQLQIRTDKGGGCCLDDGAIYSHDDDDKVIRVSCELVVK